MHELKAEARSQLGRQVKIARRAGLLPAVVYGGNVASQPIAVPQKEFEKIYHAAGESTLVTLDVAGTVHTALIHDTARDPVTGRLLHADFYAVRMDKVLRVVVPVVFFGESPAVKNEVGILVKVVHELEVEAMPADLPHELRADLSHLVALKSRMLVSDIPHDANVKILASGDEVVALVDEPRSEEALAELTAAPVAEIKEVKTEREVKAAEKSKETEEENEQK